MENHLLEIERCITNLEYLNQEEANQACYQAIVQHPTCTHLNELDALFNDGEKRVVRVDSRLKIPYPHFEIVLMDSTEQKIISYTCCVVNDAIIINGKPTLHTAVWRPFFNINEEMLQKLSKETFSLYLLNQYNIMATLNNSQTHGFTFWLKRICDARAEQISVYGYRIDTSNLRPITTIDQGGKERVWLWSAENTHYRLLITAK